MITLHERRQFSPSHFMVAVIVLALGLLVYDFFRGDSVIFDKGTLRDSVNVLNQQIYLKNNEIEVLKSQYEVQKKSNEQLIEILNKQNAEKPKQTKITVTTD